MDVDGYLAESAARIDAFLEARLPAPDAPPARLHAAMRHLLFPGGKRLRPALAFAACESVGGAAERALPGAAAVELIHTYSLVHDDLPCMDDDAVRRGRPTVHMAFDEATAVLAGDALQAEAFAVLAESAALPVACLRILAEAAGSRGLVGGQADDLGFAAAGAAHDVPVLESIHRRKTAALIGAAVRLGAVAGEATDAQRASLERFGAAVGLGFQITDDCLDHDGDDGCSYVALAGVEAARSRAEALLAEALGEIESWGEPAEALRQLARFAVRRNR